MDKRNNILLHYVVGLKMDFIPNVNLLQSDLIGGGTVSKDHLHIKSEITFEDEKITETTFMDLPMEQICQVEVETAQGISDELTPSYINVGEMCALQKDVEQDTQNDLEFSDALNDHNYTSQEVLSQPKLDNVKDVLLSYIITNGSIVETIPENVTNFIDDTIDKMKQLKLKNIDKKADENPLNECLTRSNTILSENCSEPLEVEGSDEYFESLYKHMAENKSVLSTILTNTIDFVKDFYNECKSLSSKTEEEFKEYIFEKIKKLKIVANINKTSDQSIQTFSKGSLKKRRRINHNAKKYLLDTSATSTTESECESLDGPNKDENPKDRNLLAKPLDETYSLKREFEYSDGIDLSKYINLGFNNSNFWQTSRDFDNDNTNSGSSENNTDKEIERFVSQNVIKICRSGVIGLTNSSSYYPFLT